MAARYGASYPYGTSSSLAAGYGAAAPLHKGGAPTASSSLAPSATTGYSSRPSSGTAYSTTPSVIVHRTSPPSPRSASPVARAHAPTSSYRPPSPLATKLSSAPAYGSALPPSPALASAAAARASAEAAARSAAAAAAAAAAAPPSERLRLLSARIDHLRSSNGAAGYATNPTSTTASSSTTMHTSYHTGLHKGGDAEALPEDDGGAARLYRAAMSSGPVRARLPFSSGGGSLGYESAYSTSTTRAAPPGAAMTTPRLPVSSEDARAARESGLERLMRPRSRSGSLDTGASVRSATPTRSVVAPVVPASLVNPRAIESSATRRVVQINASVAPPVDRRPSLDASALRSVPTPTYANEYARDSARSTSASSSSSSYSSSSSHASNGGAAASSHAARAPYPSGIPTARSSTLLAAKAAAGVYSDEKAAPIVVRRPSATSLPVAHPASALRRTAPFRAEASSEDEMDDDVEDADDAGSQYSDDSLDARSSQRLTSNRGAPVASRSALSTSESKRQSLTSMQAPARYQSTHAGATAATARSYKLVLRPDGKLRALVGLGNLGNTCFMNSCLQCVLSTAPLVSAFASGDVAREESNPRSPTRGRLLAAFAELVHAVVRGSDHSVERPAQLKKVVATVAPRFAGYGQQDSHEFLRFLLDGLHDDMNRVHRPPPYEQIEDRAGESVQAMADRWWRNYTERNNSLISDLFCGQLRSEVVCCSCGHSSTAFDPFMDLSVPIPSASSYDTAVTLYDCFDALHAEDLLRGQDQYYCRRCKTHRDSRKRLSIYRFPRVLVVQLKRFRFDGYSRQKLNTNVQLPLALDLSSWAVHSHEALTRKNPTVRYRLYAVSQHMGSTGGGHYTATAKVAPDDSSWCAFNDSHVHPIATNSISGGASAYLLFFEREEV